MPHNLEEGRQRKGRDRTNHYRYAAGSAGEVKAALLVSQAWGWVGEDAIVALSLVDRLSAMCWRLSR